MNLKNNVSIDRRLPLHTFISYEVSSYRFGREPPGDTTEQSLIDVAHITG